MANAAGFIQESIWRDEHWRQLSRSAQALYMQLLSQKELDCAGILPMQPNKWAKGCSGLTVEQVWDDLDELQRERFVYYDVDTDELFVRSYMRNSNVMKSPNMRRAATRAAVLVGSAFLKPLLAEELRAVGAAMGDNECLTAADKINPSRTPPEPFPNGSNRTVPEPFAEPSGAGVGVGEGVTSGGSSVGESRPQCSKHPENSDGPCIACKRRREWDDSRAADELDVKRVARDARRQAINDCPLCDENGMASGRGGLRRCDHQAVAQ
jgi:hypothetical protein